MIRTYHRTDKPALLQLIRLNTPKYFHPSEESWFSYYLDKETEDYYVMEQNGSIVGCGGVNYKNDKRIAILSWDIIHPRRHGKGMGSALATFRIHHIKENTTAQKIVVRTSQHTYGFYLKLGFTLIYTKEDHWAPGMDLYYMETTVG